MLTQRILTALLLAPLVVIAVLFLPTPFLALVAGAVFLLGYDEWAMLAGFRAAWARLLAVLLAAAVMLALYWLGSPWVDRLPLTIGVLWWLLALAWLRHISFAAAPTRENGLIKLGAGLLVVVPAWAAMVWLHGHTRYGIWLLVAMLVVWGADTGAYFAGSKFGRRKLAPRISPGKTWAGVCGALVVSALVALVAGLMIGLEPGALAGLMLLTVIAVLASVSGDLLESLFKRHAMVKDSGTLFPGHGGFMDRLDSVCALLPVFAAGVWLLGL